MTASRSSSPTVFISGAAAGIGRATAALFAGRGYRVGAYDIDIAGLASLPKAKRKKAISDCLDAAKPYLHPFLSRLA